MRGGPSKLNSKQRQELILGLCRGICVLRSPSEVADALTDLLTPQELEAVAKRLEIAQHLIERKQYDVIRARLRVGYSTIARVNTWLNLAGEGFKLMLSRRKKSPKPEPDEEKYDPYSWRNVKRRYSLYFWPQLLVEELWKQGDKSEQAKIKQIFEKLSIKRWQFRSGRNRELYEQFNNWSVNPKKPNPEKTI